MIGNLHKPLSITPEILKKLKALEIIKKYIYVGKPFNSACYIYLNDESEFIPEAEYELLKEVLNDEESI